MSTLIAMPPRRQRGIVLMVALVMLVTITLLAIMTLGSATTEQKIAATGHFHNMGFQGAESAIEPQLKGDSAVFSHYQHLSADLMSTTPTSSGASSFGSGPNSVSITTQMRYRGDSDASRYVTGEKLGPPAPPGEVVSGEGNAGSKCFHFAIRGKGTVGTELNLSAATEQGICLVRNI
jgi:Tfp pilus assembly protein PilX